MIEVYGDLFVDGTNQSWEYLDSWAYKSFTCSEAISSIDVDQSNWEEEFIITGSDWYQSFTAVHGGQLESFSFLLNGAQPSSATVTLRNGEGESGTVLYTSSSPWNYSPAAGPWTTYVIPENVQIFAGQLYSIQLSGFNGSSTFLGHTNNVYDGGHFESSQGGLSGDLAFKVSVLAETIPCHPGDINSCNGNPRSCTYNGTGENWTYGGINCTDGSTTIFDSTCLYPLCE